MSEQNGGGESERTYHVDLMTRVEGEGRFFVHVKDGAVLDARLEIFEAPRFFEGFVRGREPDEVVDIVARICGICPVAYQVSASRAFEAAFGAGEDDGGHWCWGPEITGLAQAPSVWAVARARWAAI